MILPPMSYQIDFVLEKERPKNDEFQNTPTIMYCVSLN